MGKGKNCRFSFLGKLGKLLQRALEVEGGLGPMEKAQIQGKGGVLQSYKGKALSQLAEGSAAVKKTPNGKREKWQSLKLREEDTCRGLEKLSRKTL